MSIFEIQPLTVVTTETLKELREAWKVHGGVYSLVGTFIVRKPLTAAQYSRLPQGLKDRLKQGDENDSLSFLEQLYRLNDPR